MYSEAKGMKTYWNILMSIRANGGLIGSRYFMHDKQFKDWCKNKTTEEIMTVAERKFLEKKQAKETKKRSVERMAEDTKHEMSAEEIQALVKKVLDKSQPSEFKTVASSIVKTVTSLDKAIVASNNKKKNKEVVLTQEQKDKILKEKLKQIEMKKLADSLTGYDRLKHIKSVGNGL